LASGYGVLDAAFDHTFAIGGVDFEGGGAVGADSVGVDAAGLFQDALVVGAEEVLGVAAGALGAGVGEAAGLFGRAVASVRDEVALSAGCAVFDGLLEGAACGGFDVALRAEEALSGEGD
jgi:hypothetical protein